VESGEIRKKIKEAIAKVSDIELEEIPDEASFVDDLGLDSLVLLEISVEMELEFGVEVSEDDLRTLVTIQDAVDLYRHALLRAPAGAFYFVENGEASLAEIAEAIARRLSLGPPEAWPIEEAAQEWGRGRAVHSLGSNSRVRAVRAREELGWSPSAPSLLDEVESGCYKV